MQLNANARWKPGGRLLFVSGGPQFDPAAATSTGFSL